ncbi:hypothetical protein [Lysinibacillus sphaericus]|nr:hypothetical protein [Lysinibacillus sphaericus]
MQKFNLTFNENDSFVKKVAKTLTIQAMVTIAAVVGSWMLLSIQHFLMN